MNQKPCSQIRQETFQSELEKIAGKKKKHPVSEAQRRWAWWAEEKGDLPKGKAHTWSKRVEDKDLPKHASLDDIRQSALENELQKIALSADTMRSAAAKLLQRAYKTPYGEKAKKDISRASRLLK